MASNGTPAILLAPDELLPLSQERRDALLEERGRMLSGWLVPQIVAPVENLIAQKFAENLVEPVAGRVGYQDLLSLNTPAAGADAVYTVPGRHVLWPLSVIATLTTSAAVKDRTLAVEYRDADGSRYLIGGAPVTVGASDAREWVWQPLAGAAAWPVEDAVIAPLPQQHVYPGNALAVRIGNADAGDQLSGVRVSAWLYPTGPQEL